MKRREPQLAEKIEANELTVEFYRNLLNEIMTTYKMYLDEKTSIQILQSHGRFKECLDFAEKLGKFEEIILNYMNEKDYKSAVQKIKNYIDTLYRMKKHAPEEEKKQKDELIFSMIDFFLKHSKELILNEEGIINL